MYHTAISCHLILTFLEFVAFLGSQYAFVFQRQNIWTRFSFKLIKKMNPYLENYTSGQFWKIKMLIYHRREYSLFKVLSGFDTRLSPTFSSLTYFFLLNSIDETKYFLSIRRNKKMICQKSCFRKQRHSSS